MKDLFHFENIYLDDFNGIIFHKNKELNIIVIFLTNCLAHTF